MICPKPPRQRLFLALLAACLPTAATFADQQSNTLPVYVGGSLGLSYLSPDPITGGTEHGNAHSATVQLGIDINDKASIEVFAADLGSAAITDGKHYQGSVSYREAGISLIGYAFRPEKNQSGHHANHRGLAIYGRLGASQVNTNYESSAEMDTDEVEVVVGVGSEYGWDNGLGARAEFSVRGSSVQSVNFGLVKRFRSEADAALSATTKKAAARMAETEPLWSNRLSISLPTLHFPAKRMKKRLNREQESALQQLAEELKRYNNLEIVVQGHSANIGTAKDRLKSSREQAILVSRYLQSRGVSGNRMHLRSYGDTQPYTTQLDTPESGLNQRVDFQILSRG